MPAGATPSIAPSPGPPDRSFPTGLPEAPRQPPVGSAVARAAPGTVTADVAVSPSPAEHVEKRGFGWGRVSRRRAGR